MINYKINFYNNYKIDLNHNFNAATKEFESTISFIRSRGSFNVHIVVVVVTGDIPKRSRITDR